MIYGTGAGKVLKHTNVGIRNIKHKNVAMIS